MQDNPAVESPVRMTWKILVIDDDEDDLILVKEMLKEAKGRKFDVQWASTYEAGREALHSNLFDAVLVDYDLGLKTGIHLIREANEQGYASPLILFTGRGSYEVDVEAMQAGATLYLAKSEATPLLLERAIRYAIELKQKEQSLREGEAHLRENEAALRKAHERSVWLARFPEENPNPTARVSENGTILFCNRASADPQFWAFEEGGLIPLSFRSLLEEANKQGKRVEGDVQIGERFYSVTVMPFPSDHYVNFYGRDITERRRAEEALRESEQRYTALFHAKTNGIAHCRVIIDEQGKPIDYEYLQVNQAYEALTGHKSSEIVGRRAREVFPEIENSAYDYIGNYGRLALHGGELNIETFSEAIGKWLSVYIYTPKQGEFTAIFTDISQRKQAEEALKKTYNDLINEQNRLLAVMEALPIGISILDRRGGVIQTNKGYEAIWGNPLPPTNSVDDYEAYQAWWVETGQRVQSEEWASTLAVRKGETVTGQFLQIQRFDGTRAFVLNSGAPTRNVNGEITGSAVAIMDITKLIEVENALRESQDRFRVAVNAAPLMVYTCDQDLRYTWIYNPLRGFRAEDVLGKRDDEVLPQEDVADLMAAKQKALETGQGGMHELKVPLNGENAYYILTTEVIRDKHGNVTGLTCSAIDITDQKRLQMEQQEQAIQIEVQRRLMDQRERDRNAIARDLHDGPIQTLSSTMFNLKLIKDVFPDPLLQTELTRLGTDIKNTVRELRDVMNDLRPPALITFGFSKVLIQYIDDLRKRFPDLEIVLDTVEDDKKLSAQAHLTLFRIFQAGINNIIRHSAASKVWVVYKLEPDYFFLELSDNGGGFDLKKGLSHLARNGHFGLVGMRERAEAIGAEFSVSSEPGKGATIVVKGFFNVKNLK